MRLSKSAVNHRLRRLVDIADGAGTDEDEEAAPQAVAAEAPARVTTQPSSAPPPMRTPPPRGSWVREPAAARLA